MFSINEYMKMNTTLLLMLDWTCAHSGLFSFFLSCCRFLCVQFSSSYILVYKMLLLKKKKKKKNLAAHLCLSLVLHLFPSCLILNLVPVFFTFLVLAGVALSKTLLALWRTGFEVSLCATLPGKALGDGTKLISVCCGQIASQWLISKHFYNS